MKVKFVVTNNGNVTLTNVKLTDDKIPADKLPRLPKTTLKPGEKVEVETIIKAPSAGKAHVNTATVEGTPPKNPDGSVPEVAKDSDPAHAYVSGSPKVEIKKYINGDDADNAPGVRVEPDSDMVVKFVITNTGDVMLNDIVLRDDQIPGDQLPKLPKTSLAPGETMEVETTIKAPKPGTSHVNTATVEATPPVDPDGTTPGAPKSSDEAHAYAPGASHLSVEKYINDVDADTEDTAVELASGTRDMRVKFVATNTGNTELTNVTIKDEIVQGSEDPLAINALIEKGTFTLSDNDPATEDRSQSNGHITLKPGETAFLEVTALAPAIGEVHQNKATGTATDPTGETLRGDDLGFAKTQEETTPVQVDKQAPKPTKPEERTLARTGANVSSLVAAMAVLIAASLALFAARRRSTN